MSLNFADIKTTMPTAMHNKPKHSHFIAADEQAFGHIVTANRLVAESLLARGTVVTVQLEQMTAYAIVDKVIASTVSIYAVLESKAQILLRWFTSFKLQTSANQPCVSKYHSTRWRRRRTMTGRRLTKKHDKVLLICYAMMVESIAQ